MWVFTGLGNPGRQFLYNRHNIGFMAIDYASSRLNILKTTRAFKSLIMHARTESNEIMIVKPLTYMNKSGEALKQISLNYDISPQELVMIYDDLYLPLGKIRIKPKGGSGGHQGMISIISSLKTKEIPRIRVGTKEEQAVTADAYSDYVLSDFSEPELEIVHEMLERVFEAMVCICKDGLHTSMNKFNKK